MTEDLKKIR